MPLDILPALRTWGRAGAADLRRRLAISPATLMRAVRAAGDDVLVRGSARRSTYAARRTLRGSAAPIPVYRIDRAGAAHAQGLLHLAWPDGSVLDATEPLEWPVDGPDMADGWYDGLPWPMQDMRPQGFLGRHFARRHAAILQVDDDPNRWSDDDALHALTLLGDDAPGNLILGEPAYRLWLDSIANPQAAIPSAKRGARYAELADAALRLGVVGSSAGGEFPKFTAVRRVVGATDADVTHVIVKFSGNDDSPGTRRWSDLLVCEHLAARVVEERLRVPAARTDLVQAAGRTFLEVTRFDRHGPHGRSGLVSLQSLNGAFVGANAAAWPATVLRLDALRLLHASALPRATLLWHFGRLIANTDMHEGNLSFQPGTDEQPGLHVAPSYDMLPMLYAPARGVEVAERHFEPPLPLPGEAEAWRAAAHAAADFWQRASREPHISAAFRAICAENRRKVEAAIRHPAVAG